MKTEIPASFIICILIASCSSISSEKANPKLKDIVVKEIPLDAKGRTVLSYNSIQNDVSLLQLGDLSKGFDSLQIRIWYAYSRLDSGQVFVLKNVKSKWSANGYTLLYNFNNQHDSLLSISKTFWEKQPLSGWENFLSKLFSHSITELPDMRSIQNYPHIVHGNSVIIEISTLSKYRFLRYSSPLLAQDSILEAKKIENIINLLEYEFRFHPLQKL